MPMREILCYTKKLFIVLWPRGKKCHIPHRNSLFFAVFAPTGRRTVSRQVMMEKNSLTEKEKKKIQRGADLMEKAPVSCQNLFLHPGLFPPPTTRGLKSTFCQLSQPLTRAAMFNSCTQMLCVAPTLFKLTADPPGVVFTCSR